MTWTSLEKIEIELSGDCNAACPLCPRTEANLPLKGNGNHTLEDVKRSFGHLVPKFQEAEFEIALYGLGGDPVLNPECYEITKWFTENGAKIIISTNGGYQTVEWWEKMAALTNTRVKWAVDGGPQTNHIYRVNVVWNTVMRNMEAFMNAGGTGSWVFIPFDHNMDDFDFARSTADRLGMNFESKTSGRNALHEGSQVKKSKSKKDTTTVTLQEVEDKEYNHEDLSELKEIRRQQDRKIEGKEFNNEVLVKAATTVKCKAIDGKEVYVSNKSELYPCCHLHDDIDFARVYDFGKDMPKGWNDIRKHSINDIIKSAPFSELEDRWNPDHKLHVPRCVSTCGSNAAYIPNTKLLDKKS